MIYSEDAEHRQEIIVPCLYKTHILTIKSNDSKKSQNLQLLLVVFLNERKGF